MQFANREIELSNMDWCGFKVWISIQTEYAQQVTQNGQMREKILGRGRTKTVPLVIPKYSVN